MRRLTSFAGGLICSVIGFACSSSPHEETVVCIRAEDGVESRATLISIRVTNVSGDLVYGPEESALGGDVLWPIGLPHRPREGASGGSFTTFVDVEDSDGTVFIEGAVRGSYADELRAVDMLLEDACIGMTSCGFGEICVAGACAPIPTPSLRTVGEPSLAAACGADPPMDGGVRDATAFDAPVHDGTLPDADAPDASDVDGGDPDGGTPDAGCTLSAFGRPEHVPELSSTGADTVAVPSPDGQQMYVSRSGVVYSFERLAVPPGGYGPATIVTDLESPDIDRVVDFSNDGRTVYLVSRRGGLPAQELFTATRSAPGAAFGAPTPLLPGVQMLDARLSPDELTVFYATPAYDLWRVTRPTPTGAFGTPERIDELSTSDEERHLCVAPDGLAFYQAHMLAPDILTARYDAGTRTFTPTGAWEWDVDGRGDFAPTVSRDGLELWLSIDTTPTVGNLDFWVSRRTCVP